MENGRGSQQPGAFPSTPGNSVPRPVLLFVFVLVVADARRLVGTGTAPCALLAPPPPVQQNTKGHCVPLACTPTPKSARINISTCFPMHSAFLVPGGWCLVEVESCSELRAPELGLGPSCVHSLELRGQSQRRPPGLASAVLGLRDSA
jgi:hypothetical protein